MLMQRTYLFLTLLLLPWVVGCEGCRRDTTAETSQQQEPLADFSASPAISFPSDGLAEGGVKPGHWITASQPLKSNKLDVRGELSCRVTAWSTSSQDGREDRQSDRFAALRPVVLPKGQLRRFDYRILAPVPLLGDRRRIDLDNRLITAGRAVDVANMNRTYNRLLSSEEFFFVVLTNRPERFARFQVSDWVRPYRDELELGVTRANYRVLIPATKDLLPLAETMLDWTSTAVVFWDDLSPDALTPQQQTAIADWVRFGGQLIVNGAEASEAVSKTMLAELLPLRPTGNVELDPAAATRLLQSWSVSSDPSTEKQIALVSGQASRVAVDGPLASDAQVLGDCGGLLLARRVGGGRVVQSRFDLTSDWLVNWQSYDSFVNGVVLLRPRRVFKEDRDAEAGLLLRQRYPDFDLALADPTFNTRFRIAARDAVLPRSGAGDRFTPGLSSRVDPLTAVHAVSGISGWNDDSDLIGLSRQILRDESGIEIPKSSLVVRSLGYYLLVLVPLNYLVFRLMGRLEYAWLTVPVIAIVGAIWVARAARLDIGFARSQTELAFLEMHAGYPRGHLSRVVAIYNSLSTTYAIGFDQLDAVAAPIRSGGSSSDADGIEFRTGFSEGPVLAGLPVISNQVRLIRAEQVVGVGGSIEINAAGQLVNQSDLELSDGVVVEKTGDGSVRLAVVGPFAKGAMASLRFLPAEQVSLADDLPMQTGEMIRRLIAADALPAGSSRLVARYDGSVEGMNISPATQQRVAQTVVLVHLDYPAWPQPQSDVNLIGDFRRGSKDPDGGFSEQTDSDERDDP